jgi:hypothetical protein
MAQRLKIRCGAAERHQVSSSATRKPPDIVASKHLDGSVHPMLTSTKRLDVGMA